MTPDQAAHAILRGDYSVEAAEVWIDWRQKHNTTMIMDRLCAWLVSRVKELEAAGDLVPRGTPLHAELTPVVLQNEIARFLAAITHLDRNTERLIHRCGLEDYTIRKQAAQELRHAIHLVFSDALTLLDKIAL